MVNNIHKNDFRTLLTMATKDSLFIFISEYYRQVDGVAMGSPLGPTLANVFLCHHEQTWLNDCPSTYKPSLYKRYVDDVFVLFTSMVQLESFSSYLNSKHCNIYFTFEKEHDSSFSFLDIKIDRTCDKFCTSVYRKPTFSGVYTNFTSFIPLSYKYSLVYSLLFRCFRITSDFSRFHVEVKFLKDTLSKNGYPVSFVDTCVKRFLDKLYVPRAPASCFDVPKKKVLIVLPYLGTVPYKLEHA